MATFKSFEELDVWQKARLFANVIYAQTTEGNFSKDFGLKDQINRSAGSIMDNIAEGFERGGTREFLMFLSYAKGSAGETRSQIYRAHDRGYLEESVFNFLKNESINISRGLAGFMAYLRGTSIKGSRFNAPSMVQEPISDGYSDQITKP